MLIPNPVFDLMESPLEPDKPSLLNLVVLYSRDVEALARYYEALGLQLQREKHGEGPEHYSCVFGDLVFEIYPAGAGEAVTSGVRLGFQVTSLAGTVATVKSRNGRIVAGPRKTPWGRRATIEDPEGRMIDLSEVRSA
jgi:lactoylglutathione lyase